MGKSIKYISSLLCVLFVTCFFCSVFYADNALDTSYDHMWKVGNYVWGQETTETGVVCPKCGTALRQIDHGTCSKCGYNAMVVDDDGKVTFSTGGGKAGSGVGRPKAYKEDNTPAVLSTGEYTMYVHPTFVRKFTGLPFVNGTQYAIIDDDGSVDETSFFISTVEPNRISVSYFPSGDTMFNINSVVYYYITAPVTGSYQFFDWQYSDVKCAGSLQSCDSKLSIQILNLRKGDTTKEVHFSVVSNNIIKGQSTYIYAPDLMVKYTPFNEKTNSFQPLEKVPSITANNKEVTGTIYHDTVNNYYYSYDDDDNCTVYVENKKGDIIGDITYNTTENTYVTNIYPGATIGDDEPESTPTPDPGENPTPTPTPGGGTTVTPGGDNPGSTSTPESGNKGDSGSSGWNPFKWLTDLLKDLVESILKGIWKLITSIFGFILWLLSLLFKLFPWMPNSGILALCAGVVVVTIIRIIKFITGR